MLHTVTLRLDDKHSEVHIVSDGSDRVFCGQAIPGWLLIGWPDPRSPYINKRNVTCTACLGEWNNGRTHGWRLEFPSNPEEDIQQ